MAFSRIYGISSRALVLGAALGLSAAVAAQHADHSAPQGDHAASHSGHAADHRADHGAASEHSAHSPAYHALVMAQSNPNRAADTARDPYRHPVETLSFFGVEPDMKIGEYAPGGGWYSHFLSNFIGEKGRLVGLYFDVVKGGFSPERQERVRKDAAEYGAEFAAFSGKNSANFGGYSLDMIPDGEAGTFDRILVIRMMHNLKRWGMDATEIAHMRSLLKDDGMIGIVQHRAKDDASDTYVDGNKGYLRQSDVVAFMENNGFELVDASEINANPNDTADHPQGVWEMPPVLSTKRADLADKGESDRMTLLFRKAK